MSEGELSRDVAHAVRVCGALGLLCRLCFGYGHYGLIKQSGAG